MGSHRTGIRETDIPWSDEEIAQLRALHAEGLGPAAIGVRLGRSRNAVIGKRRRLDLVPHAVSHKAGGGLPRAGKVTLPPLASLVDE